MIIDLVKNELDLIHYQVQNVQPIKQFLWSTINMNNEIPHFELEIARISLISVSKVPF